MKIVFHIGDPIICGGILIPCQYIGELRKRGYDAWGIATRQDAELEKYMGISFKTDESLRELTDKDVIIAVRWEHCEMLENYKGKKFQLVQGAENMSEAGDDWKQQCKQARENKKWKILAVSNYCIDWLERKDCMIVPNFIDKRFLDNISKN